jgi:aminoglycoside phosphotransferase family enzyme/predicted kinase
MNRCSDRLLAFLRSPQSYPQKPTKVRAVETHISWVFVAPPFVFKVKKPINLGFADFSSLEKRRYFCRRELELNRRLCPDVYLGVVPIFNNSGVYSFDRQGEIADYALKMRELPDGFFLDQLLVRHAIGEPEINRIVARLHEFYAAENPTPEIKAWGRPENLKLSTDENFSQIEPFIGRTISPAAFEAIRDYTDSFYAAHEPLFHERVAQRRILDCHGDLRLEHIHITPDAVTIFDCIEFNDRFRFIDIANDLAFLAMDFDFAERHDLSRCFLQNAARVFNDAAMLGLTNFYKCYRAVVRGKVESIAAFAEKIANSGDHARRAQRYFRLALRYAVAGSDPFLVAIMGRIGTGKTTAARDLAHELDWPIFSSDEIRKRVAGLPLTERPSAERRRELYSPEAKRQTYRKLVQDGIAAATKNGGAIIDATFSRSSDRDLLRKEATRSGVRLQFIVLDAPDELVRDRLRARATDASLASDARLEDFARLSVAFEPPGAEESVMNIVSVGDPPKTSQTVLRNLAAAQAAKFNR